MLERLQNHQAKRKGDAYGRGIALQLKTSMELEDNDAGTSTGRTIKLWRTRVRATKCRCGATDHVRINFGGCELNPKNIAEKQKSLLNASSDTNVDTL